VEHQYEGSGTARVSWPAAGTELGINIASLPGRTVWQMETCWEQSFTAINVPTPSLQYALLGKGFEIVPSSAQYNPPYCSY
jgi:hypothetical protein